jgi:hypothetical protein
MELADAILGCMTGLGTLLLGVAALFALSKKEPDLQRSALSQDGAYKKNL